MAESRPRLNVLVMGDKKSGKSTLMGHLLVKAGIVDNSVLKGYEKEGCGDAKFAWVVDRLKEEREKRRGTVRYKQWRAVIGDFDIILTDAPGGRKGMKNLLRAGQGCDTAIIAVSAGTGEFETHISSEGSLRDILTVAYSIGIKSLIIAFTKMDIRGTAFSKDRYTAISQTTLEYVRKVGFSSSAVRVVPVSGWTGDNIATRSSRMPWYEGKPLVALLGENVVPHRLELRSLRVPILEVYRRGEKTVAVGRVESGSVSVGSKLSAGGSQKFVVGSLETRHTPIDRAVAGTTVGIGFQLRPGAGGLRVGDVLGPLDDPPVLCTSFSVQILVLRTLGHRGLTAGYRPIVHVHTQAQACVVVSIDALYDRQSASPAAHPPSSLRPSQTALVTFKPTRPLCVEPFHENPSLGRVVVRDSNMLLAVGVVRSVVY